MCGPVGLSGRTRLEGAALLVSFDADAAGLLSVLLLQPDSSTLNVTTHRPVTTDIFFISRIVRNG